VPEHTIRHKAPAQVPVVVHAGNIFPQEPLDGVLVRRVAVAYGSHQVVLQRIPFGEVK